MTKFSHLFKPIQIGPFLIKNRIAVAPHGPGYAQAGLLTQQYVDYELEKAKGGAGLIIMSVGWAYPKTPAAISIGAWRKENIPLFQKLVAQVHDYDCRIFFQFGESFQRIGQGVSSVPDTGGAGAQSREMSRSDIAGMIDSYVDCAQTLMEGGFDGLELHGHGDLFSDFLSPAINRRTDDYGGSLENRMRFLSDSIDAVRKTIGPAKVLGVRLSVDDLLPQSIGLPDGVEIARRLSRSGQIDYLNIDAFIEPQLLADMVAPMYVEQGHQIYAAAAVKQVVTNIPVFTVGRIVDAVVAEQAIASGAADVVTMARALIADPELPNKIAEGRLEDVRPCLGDNQECIARVTQGLPMACTVNATVGREGAWGIGRIGPAPAPRTVMVVGGGPAGMEAARVAASRGRRVSLHEMSDALGGQVRLAERLPGRGDIGRILPWLERQLRGLDVEIVLQSKVTAAIIERKRPDAVILATGAHWLKTGYNSLNFREVAGWRQDNVLSVEQIFDEAIEPGGNVVIFDAKGFVEAPGIAELLADRGKHVEIVTPFPLLGTDALRHTQQWPHIMRRLMAKGIALTTDSMLEAVKHDEITVGNVHSGKKRVVGGVDQVVIISDRKSNASLADELAGADIKVFQAGDCWRPFNLGKAIAAGFEAGMAV